MRAYSSSLPLYDPFSVAVLGVIAAPPHRALLQVRLRACRISDPIANTSTEAKCHLQALILHSALHVA